MAGVSNAHLASMIAELKKDIQQDLSGIKNDLREMNGRQRELDSRVTRLEEKQTMAARVQMGISLLLAAIAAGIGIQR